MCEGGVIPHLLPRTSPSDSADALWRNRFYQPRGYGEVGEILRSELLLRNRRPLKPRL